MAALIRVAPYLRAVFTPRVVLELMDRRRLRSAYDVESDGLMCIAAEAANFKIVIAGVQSVTECW
jgi:hypothetical protein